MFVILGQATNFPLICCCTFILALINDSFRPANATAIAQYSKIENRTRSYSLNRLSINLGWAVGGAIGGFVAARNYHLLFWIDGATNIGAAVLLRSLLSPSRNNQTPARSAPPPQKGVQSAYKDKVYIAFVLLSMLFGCCFFQLFATVPVFFKKVLNLSPQVIGSVMALNGFLIAAFEMAVVFKLENKGRNLNYIFIGTVLGGLSFVVFNLLPGQVSLAVISTIIVTAGEMLSMPFMNTFWVSRTNEYNRGQYAGLYTAAWSIAQIVGPFAGTQIVQHYDFNVLWWVVGGVSVLTALGFRSLNGAFK